MERLSLQGQVAIITGSSSGLGEATAVLFAKRGAKVTLHGRSEAKLETVRKKLVDAGTSSNNVLIVAGDITDAALRKKLVKETVEKFGKLDILVNNAGMVEPMFLRDITEENIDTSLNVHLKAPIFMTQAALPYLVQSKGNIVNVDTAFTDEPMPGFCSYSSAKAALDHFSKIAAIEFGPSGVRVNSVRPGAIPTPIFENVFDPKTDKANYDKFMASVARRTVVGRNGTPEDIAESIAFLASAASNFITGSVIHIDGGRHVYAHSGEKAPVPDLSDLVVAEK